MFDLLLQKAELPRQINLYLYSSSVDSMESRNSMVDVTGKQETQQIPKLTVLCILPSKE